MYRVLFARISPVFTYLISFGNFHVTLLVYVLNTCVVIATGQATWQRLTSVKNVTLSLPIGLSISLNRLSLDEAIY